MVYLYAITRHSNTPVAGILGLENEPIHRLQINELDAVFSHCSKVQSNPTPSVLWMHEGVVEALMKNQCTLPVCYGTCLDNKEELEDVIRAGYDSLLHDLERLNGCIELGLRVLTVGNKKRKISRERSQIEIEGKPGTSYLYSRKNHVERFSTIENGLMGGAAEEIHEKLLEKAVDGKYTIHTSPVPMMTGAYLVRKVDLHLVQKIVGELRAQVGGYKIMCTGPWPPYNFVTPTFTLTPA